MRRLSAEARSAKADWSSWEDRQMSNGEQAKFTARTAGGITGWWSNSRSFLTEVRNEMRRVTWPSRREVYATTFVVLVTAMFFGLYLWGLDLVFDRVVRSIFRLAGVA
jgi:preprotein translocase subunit SecE